MPSLSTNPQQFMNAAEAAAAQAQAAQAAHASAISLQSQPPKPIAPASSNQNQPPTIKLQTGELVDAGTYSALSPANQVQLSQLGISGFNSYKATQQTVTQQTVTQQTVTQKPIVSSTATGIPTDSVKLDDGEYVDKTAYNALSASDQAKLTQLGVAGFNAYQTQQQADFLANNTALLSKTIVNGKSVPEYVPNTFFNELTQLAQIVLRGQGVDAFNKWASTQTIAQVYNDANWKPNFVTATNGGNPYAGMPSWYQAVEAAGFVPSAINGSTPPSQAYVPLASGVTFPTNVGQTAFDAGVKAGTIQSGSIYSGYDPLTGKISYTTPVVIPPAQSAAVSVLTSGGFVKQNTDGSYTINLTNGNGSIADVNTIKEAFPNLTADQITQFNTSHQSLLDNQQALLNQQVINAELKQYTTIVTPRFLYCTTWGSSREYSRRSSSRRRWSTRRYIKIYWSNSTND